MIINLGERQPAIGSGAFVAPSADIIGAVTLGERSSVWYNAVLRGDVEPIVIGRETNIQDGCVLHGSHERARVTVGDRVTIGHMAVIHGCKIGNGALIGIGSVVMDLAEIGEHCLVGAGSLITEREVFEPESLIFGRPAKRIRKLRADEIEKLEKSADNYLHYISWYQ